MTNASTINVPGDDIYQGRDSAAFFQGVLSRRMLAFVVDAIIILGLMVLASVVLFMLGFVTFFLSWFLFGLVFPVTALAYTAFTLGGPNSATVGMRTADLEMRTTYGAPMYPMLAAAHALAFYVSVTFLTPFILLFGLFNARRRLLHDVVCGTVVINRFRQIEVS